MRGAAWSCLLLLVAGCGPDAMNRVDEVARIDATPASPASIDVDPAPAARVLTAAEREAAWAPYVGRWEYRQANEGRPCDVDPQGEVLEISRQQDSTRLVYWGVEREGEHGLFFSVVPTLAFMDATGEVSFTVGDRSFFGQRPESVAVDPAASSGCCGHELRYSGRMEGERLVLHCRDDGYGCPDTRLEFMRGTWKCAADEA